MTLKSKGLDALFGSRHGILFCTHLEPSRWWSGRKVARILLESFGYDVLAAANGQEAMILFRRHQQQIRLLLTDVVMPDITGPQLAERLLRINPDLRVIYMSGYPAEELRGPGMHFLAKPFNPAGLSKVVR